MSRSALAILLKRAFSKATSMKVDEGRREFIRKACVATAALSLPVSCFNSKEPVIAIIGGGIGGLNTAYHLAKQNIACTVYEATGRTGGRVFTVKDAVVKGSHVDFGAEFVDTTHEDVIALAQELNVPLNDLKQDTLTPKMFFFGGKYITEEQLVEALKPFSDRLAFDIASLPENFHYSKADEFKVLDGKSVMQYLEDLGMEGWLLDFFEMAATAEYAMEASLQSAINLLIMLSVPINYENHYHLFGEYHEVMKIKGGSQQFTDALAKAIGDKVKTGWRLKELNKIEHRYELNFDVDSREEKIVADLVVLALPFTVLRSLKMNFRFPERKQKCIDTVGFGNGSKVAMGFKKRKWREQGFQGYTFTDVNKTVIWDSAQAVDVKEGSLTFVGGGNLSDDFFKKSYADIENQWLEGADKIFPGVKAEYNGKISKFCWAVHPYAKGSYTSYRVGEWSQFVGVEAEPFENILFAGEHCSVAFQGYMNGAAASGRVAAEEVMKRLEVKS